MIRTGIGLRSGELDLHLLAEGRHEGLWRHLGAQVRVHQGHLGTSFAVWAPGARAVRVVGDFNGWDGRLHPMRVLGSSGVWEIFLPGVDPGARYKFEVVSQHGQVSLRADPFAFATEVPPATASMVTQSRHEWQDAAWFARQGTTDLLHAPMSVYECHLGSWRLARDADGGGVRSPTARRPRPCPDTSVTSASPTLSSSPSRSTRSPVPGGTR